jgi:hypothetical protein
VTILSTVVEALEQLGGEASVQDLWRRTRLPVRQVDRLLGTSASRPNPPPVERVAPVRRGAHDAADVAERRWRLRRLAP